MATFDENVESIRTAVLARDVRDSIAEALEQTKEFSDAAALGKNIAQFINASSFIFSFSYDSEEDEYTITYNGTKDFVNCNGTNKSVGNSASNAQIKISTLTESGIRGYAVFYLDITDNTAGIKAITEMTADDYAVAIFYRTFIDYCGNDFTFNRYTANDFNAYTKWDNIYAHAAVPVVGKIKIDTANKKIYTEGLRLQARETGIIHTVADSEINYGTLAKPNALFHLFLNSATGTMFVKNYNDLSFRGSTSAYSTFLVLSYFNGIKWTAAAVPNTFYVNNSDVFGGLNGTSGNSKTCRIFKRVTCIGDSYTSGYVRVDSSTVVTNVPYSWTHYMESITGNKYVNLGVAGATTLSWLTNPNGYAKMLTSGKSQAYIIGLMINDGHRASLDAPDVRVPVGTSSDITAVVGGAEPTTYYGGLTKIVLNCIAQNPDAHIFVQTKPSAGSPGAFSAYNTAVRDVVAYFVGEGERVHCLDLEAYDSLYQNDSLSADLSNGHFTPLGYEQLAEILSFIMSDYINKNVTDFQTVHLIPYDEEE